MVIRISGFKNPYSLMTSFSSTFAAKIISNTDFAVAITSATPAIEAFGI
jgi:hypothetical protein